MRLPPASFWCWIPHFVDVPASFLNVFYVIRAFSWEWRPIDYLDFVAALYWVHVYFPAKSGCVHGSTQSDLWLAYFRLLPLRGYRYRIAPWQLFQQELRLATFPGAPSPAGITPGGGLSHRGTGAKGGGRASQRSQQKGKVKGKDLDTATYTPTVAACHSLPHSRVPMGS